MLSAKRQDGHQIAFQLGFLVIAFAAGRNLRKIGATLDEKELSTDNVIGRVRFSRTAVNANLTLEFVLHCKFASDFVSDSIFKNREPLAQQLESVCADFAKH